MAPGKGNVACEAGALGTHGLLGYLHYNVLAFFHNVLNIQTWTAIPTASATTHVSTAPAARTRAAITAGAARMVAWLLFFRLLGMVFFCKGSLFAFGRGFASWTWFFHFIGRAILVFFHRRSTLVLSLLGGGLWPFALFFVASFFYAGGIAIGSAASATSIFIFLVVVSFINDVSHIEEGRSFQPDVNEGSLHAGQNSHDSALINVPYDAFVFFVFDGKIGNFAVFQERDADLGKGSVNN
jgi:hypothetical protein